MSRIHTLTSSGQGPIDESFGPAPSQISKVGKAVATPIALIIQAACFVGQKTWSSVSELKSWLSEQKSVEEAPSFDDPVYETFLADTEGVEGPRSPPSNQIFPNTEDKVVGRPLDGKFAITLPSDTTAEEYLSLENKLLDLGYEQDRSNPELFTHNWRQPILLPVPEGAKDIILLRPWGPRPQPVAPSAPKAIPWRMRPRSKDVLPFTPQVVPRTTIPPRPTASIWAPTGDTAKRPDPSTYRHVGAPRKGAKATQVPSAPSLAVVQFYQQLPKPSAPPAPIDYQYIDLDAGTIHTVYQRNA